ncbi:MAG: acyltransferase [Burkholderiaceae bacterium]
MIPDESHAALKYRPEIDGLRALAVLPVLFFHAGFDAFRGGFVGVDVFFVISGYLITSIIVNDCAAGKFSIPTFYERRARRILPALFVVIAVSSLFAWLWMLPVETQAFTRSVLAAVGFLPNLYFWSTTNYFATAAEELPLLHTWSLGVEEQFYVLFPLMIWVLWRAGVRALLLSTLFLALVSFGLSEWAWRSGKLSSNFFFPVTRAWELMIGAAVALAWRIRPIHEWLPRAWCNVLSLIGLVSITCAVALFNRYTPMPSVYALVPTLGTALVIASAQQGTLAHRVLSHRTLVGIGLISYSAYLWHQPLFAFARIRITSGVRWPLFVALILSSLALAYMTWRFVESPFRTAFRVSRATLIKVSLTGALLFLCIGLASERTRGFVSRLPDEDVQLASMVNSVAQGEYVTRRFTEADRDFSRTSARKIIVIGDSFAQDFFNSIRESGMFGDAEIRTYEIPFRCQIYFGPFNVDEHIRPQDRPMCARVREAGQIRHRVAHADVVILSSDWQKWSVEHLPGTL